MPDFPDVPAAGAFEWALPALPALMPKWQQLEQMHSERMQSAPPLATVPPLDVPTAGVSAERAAAIGAGAGTIASAVAVGAVLFVGKRRRQPAHPQRRSVPMSA